MRDLPNLEKLKDRRLIECALINLYNGYGIFGAIGQTTALPTALIKIPYNDFVHHGPAVSDLAFLMLDPNPKMRITSRQLITLLNVADIEFYYHASIKKKACSECSIGFFMGMDNILLHSVYKDTDILTYPKRPEDALTGGLGNRKN